MKVNEQHIRKLTEVCNAVEGSSIYRGYSGRGMYGKRCIGISTDDKMATIEEAAAQGIRGAKTDNLGRGYIVYWPNLEES